MTFARTLADLAVKIAPVESRTWAAALKAELAYVPAASALGFAWGALTTAARLRATSPGFVEGFARFGLAASALLWAGLQVRLAMKLSAEEPATPTLILYVVGLVFAIGGVATALTGLRSTIRLAVPALALAALYAVWLTVLTPPAPDRAFYLALVAEDVIALLTALLLASLAKSYVRRHTTGPT